MLSEPNISYKPFWGICRPLNSWRANSPNPIQIYCANVKWIPTVIHFEGNQNNIMEVRYNYKAYKLSQYSDKLAKKHVLNGYDGNTVSIKYITNKTKEVIDEKYLK